MAKKEAQSITDYEAQRQAKIAQNQALLKELQLNAASAGIAPSSKSKRQSNGSSSRPKEKRPKPKIKQEDLQPTRTSSRLRGIVADSEVAKRKAEEENVRTREVERAKRQRVTGDLNAGDIMVVGENWNQTGNWLRNVRGAVPYERTFDEEDIKKTSSKELRELREKMSGLELWEGIEPNRIKITPERIYAMNFHPTEDKALVFAGDKLGNLGVFDASQSVVKQEEDEDADDLNSDFTPAISTFKPHTRTISSIHFNPASPKTVYTSSYDSSIRQFDLEKGLSTELYGPSDIEVDEPISAVSVPASDPHTIYFTTLNGLFGMHDTRTKPSSPTQLLNLSEKKIGGFSLHPLHPHLAATASLDRTLKLWDLRKISGKGDWRLPALVAEHESKLSVSHAAFNAAGQIATSSYDDTIKIHTLDNPSSWSVGHTIDDFSPSTIIPHNNQTGRWVTILRPQWQMAPSGQQKFVIGNMNRFVDVYAGTGEQLAQLGGDGITAVPAVAVFHPSCDWVAGGTASGKLALWQ